MILQITRDKDYLIKECFKVDRVKYKDYLTEEQLVLLEELSDMSIFKIIGLLCSHPGSGIADTGYKSLIKEFIEMQDKDLALKNLVR